MVTLTTVNIIKLSGTVISKCCNYPEESIYLKADELVPGGRDREKKMPI